MFWLAPGDLAVGRLMGQATGPWLSFQGSILVRIWLALGLLSGVYICYSALWAESAITPQGNFWDMIVAFYATLSHCQLGC